jgi:hypothetical protein
MVAENLYIQMGGLGSQCLSHKIHVISVFGNLTFVCGVVSGVVGYIINHYYLSNNAQFTPMWKTLA